VDIGIGRDSQVAFGLREGPEPGSETLQSLGLGASEAGSVHYQSLGDLFGLEEFWDFFWSGESVAGNAEDLCVGFELFGGPDAEEVGGGQGDALPLVESEPLGEFGHEGGLARPRRPDYDQDVGAVGRLALWCDLEASGEDVSQVVTEFTAAGLFAFLGGLPGDGGCALAVEALCGEFLGCRRVRRR